jgi:hypothetical protein
MRGKNPDFLPNGKKQNSYRRQSGAFPADFLFFYDLVCENENHGL